MPIYRGRQPAGVRIEHEAPAAVEVVVSSGPFEWQTEFFARAEARFDAGPPGGGSVILRIGYEQAEDLADRLAVFSGKYRELEAKYDRLRGKICELLGET